MGIHEIDNDGHRESYAHRPKQDRVESYAHRSSSDPSADITEKVVHQSSGKKEASKTVTPTQYGQDDNVTKRDRGLARSLTSSPKEKMLPVDAQIIGALNDMEINDTSNIEVGADDTSMVAEDDLLGEELMDMEAGVIKEAEANVEKADMVMIEKSKTSSSYRV